MKEKDLGIGEVYCFVYEGNRQGKLMGFDPDGDPVMQPMNENTKHIFNLFNSAIEEVIPECKAGCWGFSMKVFLKYYMPLKDINS